ncbi:MAG: MFS transporter [Oscillospiraceae bacterium]|nr:MFS transporter [Oscillospiraceae bacterium]
MKQQKGLSMRRILAFGAGDIFGGGSFNIVNFLYPGYIVLAVGMPPYMAGIIMMIARIFDAVIDPPLGFISDKMRVRYGTRRRSMLICAPLIVLSMFLMFYPHGNPSMMIRFWAALISYLFYCLVQSSIMIPYFSLASEITEDYTERAKMTSVRLGFSIFASIVCVAMPGMIVNAFEGHDGYIVMSLLFGSMFMLCVGVTALFAKEGIPPPQKAEKFSLPDLIRPFRLKTFRQYLWIYLCCQMTMAVMSALFFFYVDFVFCSDVTARGEGNIVGLLGAAIMFGMQIVALPVYMMMIRKTGKMTVYIVGSLIWITGALYLFFIQPNTSPIQIYVLGAVLGFGISGPGLIPHAIFGDVVDAGHLKFSVRDAGAFSGIANFVNTVAQALGIAAVMFIIGAAGFKEPAVGEVILQQSRSAQTSIVWCMALAPLILLSFGVFICTRYRLNKEKHEEVLAALEGSEEEKDAALQSL